MKLSLKDIVRVSLFTALMVVGAFIRIPFPFLPVTLQAFFCAFSGILLGARLGLLSQIVYILMGLVGLPVFSNGGGITYIFKPSFGYIIGFAVAAFVIGKISESNKKTLLNTLVSLYSGLFVIYAIGLCYAYVVSTLYLGKTNVAFVSMAILPIFIKDIILFGIIAVVVDKMPLNIRDTGLFIHS